MAEIRALTPVDLDAAAALLAVELGGREQARLGELHDVLALPGFGAWLDGALVGVATFHDTELAALAVASEHRLGGIGSRLIETVAAAVEATGAPEIWLVTTNDNLDALRLYQRRGFRLSRVEIGGVDRARGLKPGIPPTGHYGIPMHDELVLVRPLNQ